MGIKSFLFRNTKIAKTILSKLPASYVEGKSRTKAFSVYKNSLRIGAYKQFLKDSKFEPDISINEFKKIPLTTKKNYFQKYSFIDLNKEHNPYLYYRSSGYSGEPTYWTQNSEDYKSFIEYMDFNLRYMFDISRKRTLIISTYAMSSWVTGQQVLSGLSFVASKYDTVTYFVCGMVVDEAIDMLQRYAMNYDQVLVFAYPLTFKELVDRSEEKKVNLKEMNVYAVIGAEGVTYSWSKYYSLKLSKDNIEEYRVLSAYGTADTGIGIASEQRSALILKDLVYENLDLRKELTGREDMPLHFFQYNPLESYLELVDGELVITRDKQMPLVRYNLHDDASIIPFEKLMKLMKKFDIDFLNKVRSSGYDLFQLPLFAIYGRTDGTIILNGANVYINSFKEALHQNSIAHLHTGKFRVKKFNEKDMYQNYSIEIELHNHIEPTSELKRLLKSEVIKFLVKNDKGYNAAYHLPYYREDVCNIEFVSYKDEKSIKHKYIEK